MRSFLEVFFTRHYFQTQSSLINYMTSQDFLDIIRAGSLRILDIGSGPAVASLAITEMLVSILKHLKKLDDCPKGKVVNINYVLNDTSGICLGTGQRMLTNYFQMMNKHRTGIVHGRTISVQKAFPDNMNQLRRIEFNIGKYDIAILSYVISPLKEEKGFDHLIYGLSNIEKLCDHNGKILILQDRFQATLMRRLGKVICVSCHKEELTQQIYPNRNANKTYTYSYYHCLYQPTREIIFRKDFAA